MHESVLLSEAVDALVTDPDGFYIDGTLGRAGHSQLILSRLSEKGRLLAIDKDPSAIAYAEDKFRHESRFSAVLGSFAQIDSLCRAWIEQVGFSGSLMGVLLDLGVSSPQLDQAERGFSFLRDGPLDMRMNNQAGISAEQWIAQVSEAEFIRILREYGEERYAKHIARAVVRERAVQPITRTGQLAEIVKQAHPRWELHKHPATRAFQAIRIAVNNELDDLSQGLNRSLDVLVKNGRLVVVSFHSLEDRIVKQFIQRQVTGDEGSLPRGFPIREDQLKKYLRKVGPAVRPSSVEVSRNPRARSATMRVAEKIV